MGSRPLRILLVLAVGALAGLFVGGGMGAAVWLLLTGEPEPMGEVQASPGFDIEATITENYINRIMVASANEMAGPVSLIEGHMDLHPGSRADFMVRLQAGPLEPIVEGTVGFRVTADRASIEVVLLDAWLGRLRLNRVVPAGALDGINADIKQLLVDKVGSQGLGVLGVVSDEDTLRVHLGRSE